MKQRLDQYLKENAFTASRELAKSMIMSGQVLVNDHIVDKPGTLIDQKASVRLKNAQEKYVSRGGYKLEHALAVFQIDCHERKTLDVGASTGGFSDCLLQHGAALVYAIDVGHNQLAWKIRNHPKVIAKEKLNFRYCEYEPLFSEISLVVVDVSFISIRLFFDLFENYFNQNTDFIFLIKPQFEVGRDKIDRGGVVKNTAYHDQVIDEIITKAQEHQLSYIAQVPSPITGKKKQNIEYLAHFRLEK